MSFDCANKILTISPEGILLFKHDGALIKQNPSFSVISGVSLNLGDNIFSLSGTDFPWEEIKESFSKKASSKFKFTFPLTHKTAAISCCPLSDSSEKNYFLVSLTDITELSELKAHLSSKKALDEKYQAEISEIKNQIMSSGNIVAEDEKSLEILHNANKIAKVNATALILGETGVGKEVVAEYIYKNSSRSDKAFIKINCGAIPENLIESELFGYEKGAFTGARNEGKAGLFEVANKGSIFLDEIGELSLDMQVKLLRVLQEKEFVRIGGSKPIKTDVRVIAATNRNLREMVEKRLFRQDLFYRLNVLPITVPPIRERKKDIIPLVKYFLAEANNVYELNKSFSGNALQLFTEYPWPGNAREIKNVVERLVIMSESDFIYPKDISLNTTLAPYVSEVSNTGINLKGILERIEFDYISRAAESHSSIREAAKSLNMTKPTFIRKRKYYMDKYSENK